MPSPLKVLALAVVLLAGCGSTPPSSLYVLESRAIASSQASLGGWKIEVSSVRIPDLWDRPQMVLSKPDGQVDLNEFNRWAVPLKSEVPRVLTRNLVSFLGTQPLWLREDFPGARPDLRLLVTIEKIEAVAGKHLEMEASWEIRGTESTAPAEFQKVWPRVRTGRTQIREPLAPESSYAAVAGATSQALVVLSEKIARDIQGLPPRR